MEATRSEKSPDADTDCCVASRWEVRVVKDVLGAVMGPKLFYVSLFELWVHFTSLYLLVRVTHAPLYIK